MCFFGRFGRDLHQRRRFLHACDFQIVNVSLTSPVSSINCMRVKLRLHFQVLTINSPREQ